MLGSDVVQIKLIERIVKGFDRTHRAQTQDVTSGGFVHLSAD